MIIHGVLYCSVFGYADLPYHGHTKKQAQMTQNVPIRNAAEQSTLYEWDSQTHMFISIFTQPSFKCKSKVVYSLKPASEDYRGCSHRTKGYQH